MSGLIYLAAAVALDGALSLPGVDASARRSDLIFPFETFRFFPSIT